MKLKDYGVCYNATGKTCSGKAQPGVRAFRDVVDDLLAEIGDLGIYNCRPVRGGGSLSTHGEGRGWDAACNANDPKRKAVGDQLAAFLDIYHAAFGIQRIIWNRRQWDVKSGVWRAYKGVSPHTDHLHIEFCWESAKTLTTEYVQFVFDTYWEEDMTYEQFRDYLKKFIAEEKIDFGYPKGAPDEQQKRTLAHVVRDLLGKK